MQKIEQINSLPKSGTSRQYRRSVLRASAEIMPEERKLEDFLSFTASLAGQILYYNFQNEKNKNDTWSEFFISDPTFVLADILSFDSKSHQAEFEEEIKTLQYLVFTQQDNADELHQMMHRVFRTIERADTWLTAFRRTDDSLYGFKKELWSIKEELQGLLDDVVVLHKPFEGDTGHTLNHLNLDTLQVTTGGVQVGKEIERPQNKGQLTSEMIDQMIEIYRNFSISLSHVKDAAGRYFDRSLKTQTHEPHTGLFITFLQLFGELSKNFDDYTSKHRSFYYKQVLKTRPRGAIPDNAILTFKIDETHNYASLQKGALFQAGKDDGGNEILFETTSPIALNKAVITGIRTCFLGSNQLYKPKVDPDGDFITGIYVADRTELNFSGTKWPLLGEDQTGLLEQNRTMDDALVGFAISAPAFFLKEGKREISLSFHFEKESFETFIDYVKELAESEDSIYFKSDEKPERSLLFRLFLDGFLLDYTSDTGWVQKAIFFVDIPSMDSAASNPRLDLKFILEPDEPAVSAYQKDIHGQKFEKPYPVIRLRVNPNGHLFAYSILKHLKIVSTSCDINVSRLKNVVVYNDIGLVNASEAFLPFGPVPVKNSWMALSHPEAFNKNIDSISLELTWEQLPDLPYGFYGYYKGYPGKIDNQAFNVRLFSLDESRWKPLERSSRFLFRTQRDIEIKGRIAPEPTGRLRNITRLNDISLVNTNVVDRPDNIDQLPEYTSKTERGFLKIALTSPEQAFGHKQYPLLLSNTFLKNAKIKKLNKMVSMPEEPYTPVLRRITMDYRQSFNKSVKEPSARGGFDLYHIRTFDDSLIINNDLQDESEFLFPLFDDPAVTNDDQPDDPESNLSKGKRRGLIELEITGSSPPQILSLFFQIRDTARDNFYNDVPDIYWEYHINDEWRHFDDNAVIRDGTKNFMNSGIVVLDLPEVLRNDPDYLEQNIIRIRAYTNENAEYVGQAVGITTQAAEVKRVITRDDDPMLTIPAGTISTVKGGHLGISSIIQTLPSYGGTPPETSDDFYINMSERLKHRGKAVLSRDYERLILRNFDDVRMVNCIPGIAAEKWKENRKPSPGHVLITVIPDARRYPDTSRFRPRFSAGRLSEMQQFLKGKTSEFASIEVRNPRYERISVRCTVQFKPEIEEGLYLKTLSNEISRYISPWCFDPDVEIEFGKKIDLTDIRGFIHSRPYIKMVTGLSAVKITMEAKNKYELIDTTRLDADEESGAVVIEPTQQWSVMVTDRHEIISKRSKKNPEKPLKELEPEPAGISNLTLGDSFIISEGSSETIIETS